MRATTTTATATVAPLDEVKTSFMQAELSRIVAEVGVSHICDMRYRRFDNVLAWLGHVVTKKAILARPYLPDEYADLAQRLGETQTEIDDWREDVVLAVWTAIAEGDTDHAVTRAFEALARELDRRDDYKARTNKSLPKGEIVDRDFRHVAAVLTSLNPEGVKPEDDGCEIPPESVEAYAGEKLAALFDEVKKAHPYAPQKRWKCFEYFVLNVANGDIADLLAISKQKASKNNRETVEWLLDVVKKNPELLEHFRSHLAKNAL